MTQDWARAVANDDQTRAELREEIKRWLLSETEQKRFDFCQELFDDFRRCQAACAAGKWTALDLAVTVGVLEISGMIAEFYTENNDG